MADNHRIEDLRRRVQKDPSSIAFAQLAEECRRAGEFQEAVDVCRAGLELHPGYLSARVTLGRALAELDQVEAAQAELELVLKGAPDNLAAIRGLAEILHRRGLVGEALARYRTALTLSRHDPELERIVSDLAREVEPSKKPATSDPSALREPQGRPEQSRGTTGSGQVKSSAAGAARVDGTADAQTRTLAALEQWLDAIHVARAERRA
ncbi:MAG: hypothetical protein A3G76_12645 [Acidobacteria bacterium RIFCSPLOWO2_12_FULL_65_11]|nr:MAG: hypothetical protein A3H95_13825 [Acidobacteria bacterium RIFCSPLOWO2_02_FULL_64_15]OFW34416.1 MAG: hypothetical protein A3G76_12645 [Acidobacteria bacterium RIFCSPLOWO2_12_FULL_65_11]